MSIWGNDYISTEAIAFIYSRKWEKIHHSCNLSSPRGIVYLMPEHTISMQIQSPAAPLLPFQPRLKVHHQKSALVFAEPK